MIQPRKLIPPLAALLRGRATGQELASAVETRTLLNGANIIAFSALGLVVVGLGWTAYMFYEARRKERNAVDAE